MTMNDTDSSTDTNTTSTQPVAPDTPAAVVPERDDDAAPPVVTSLPAWQLVLVRATRSFLQSLVSSNIVIAAFAGGMKKQTIVAALLVATGAFVASLIQNTLELLGKLDQKAPALRG